jgi:hypothetical protein
MNMTACKRILLGGIAALFLAALASANPNLEGRWRLDPKYSSGLDGWSKMDMVFALEGSQIAITYDMQLRAIRRSKTNIFDTSKTVTSKGFFRVEQRHMAVYAAKGGMSSSTVEWIDDDRTLRTETHTPVEVSQGDVNMRITCEYRIGEEGKKLTVIEIHSSRERPLIYFMYKVKEEDSQ